MARTLSDIAQRLVAACRTGDTQPMVQELYAENAESVEPFAGPGMDSRIAHGREAILGKHEWWEQTFEVHDLSVEGPFLHGEDRFAVIFEVEATNRQTGERSRMKEVGVYYVQDGQVAREEFFFTPD